MTVLTKIITPRIYKISMRWMSYFFIGFLIAMCGPSAEASNSQNLKIASLSESEKIISRVGGNELTDDQNENNQSDRSTSTEFLMDDSALGGNLIEEITKDQAMQTALEDFQSRRCEEKGTHDRSSVTCTETLEDGTAIETKTFTATQMDEFKKQTVLNELDENGEEIEKKSLRHKIKFGHVNGSKVVEAEYFDIVTRPAKSAIIRELMIREYDPLTNKVTKMTWTKYRQIKQTDFAEITNHVALTYALDGSPMKGRVEKWQDGQVIDTIARWDRRQLNIKFEEWNNWENRINQMMLQVINIT